MTPVRPASDSRRGPGDDGVASVEFALVVPLLVAFIYIAVIAGSIYVDQLQIQSVARDAARIGSVAPTSACITARQELSTNNVGTVQCTLLQNCSAGTVQLRIIAVQNVSIPIVGNRTVTLRASSSFICQS